VDPDAATAADEAAGDPPAGSDDAGGAGERRDLATLVREEVGAAVDKLMGRGPAEPDDDESGDLVAEGVTAPGKTAAARAARGPTREQSVAEETRAELERIRKQEKHDEENASLRAEIERLGGEVKQLSEKPPEQYNRVTKALWG